MDARARSARRDEGQIARAILDRDPDAVLTVDVALRIIYLNATAARLLGPRDDGWADRDGISADAWLGEDLAHAAPWIADSGIAAACRRALEQAEAVGFAGPGPQCAPALVGRATPYDGGLIVILHDATHDLVAAPSNRTLLLDRLATLPETPGQPTGRAILMVAVERFAHDDDRTAAALGTAARDAFARRTSGLLRDTDTVAALGGGEFAVLVTALASRAEALVVAAGLHDAARQAVLADGRSYPLTLAIGVAFAADGRDDPAALLGHAEVALARARAAAPPRTASFAPGMAAVDLAWPIRERRRPPAPSAQGPPAEEAVAADAPATGAGTRADWYASVAYLLLGWLETLLALRALFRLIAASADSGVARLVYGLTAPLVAGFRGIVATPQASNGAALDLPALIAMAIYALLVVLAVRALRLVSWAPWWGGCVRNQTKGGGNSGALVP